VTDRPYTTALYLLRIVELGLSPSDLPLFEYGTILDLMVEKGNDDAEWTQVATQEDMDRF
jgi:hypothetical protein